MSFTVTSQSVIRFESSAKQEDQWKRTLMFFNVDISGEVRCDHRNEITASRTPDRNGKQRNPGGGLGNPIRKSAMSFVVPNRFYGQFRNDFDDRGFGLRRRFLGGRKKNSEYYDSPRHRSINPTRNPADMASYSHYPSVDSPDRYVLPDYETYNGYDDEYNIHFADESYQNEEYESYPEEVNDTRDRYKTGPIYERPYGYYTSEEPRPYVPQPYRNYSPRYQEEPAYNGFNPDYRDSSTYMPRQPSGSLPPEYALNYDNNHYYSNDYRKYNNASGYERLYEPNDYDYEEGFEDPQPLPGRDNQFLNSSSNHFDYEEKRPRPLPIPLPNPEAKSRKYYEKVSTPYKIYKEKDYSINQSETDMDLSQKQTKQYNEPETLKQHYQPEKLSPKNLKRIREASKKYDKISKQILGTASAKKYEKKLKTKEKMPRRASEKSQFKFYAEPEIPQPYKEYIQVKVPRRNYKPKINDEIPRRQRNSLTEPSEYLPSKKCDRYERKMYRKSSPRKEKPEDFGSEVPYRVRRREAAPSVLFAMDIPYKKKMRKKSSAHNGQCVPKRSDSGCDTGAQHSNSNCKLRRECQRLLNSPYVDYQDIAETHIAVNSPKPSNHCLLEANETIPTSGQNRSTLTQPNPSLESASPRLLSRKGIGCQYPTVFRGKCKEIKEETHQYSMYNLINSINCDRVLPNRTSEYSRRARSSCKLKRISSGSCSLNSNDKKNEPIKQSQISPSLNLTGSPRSISSKVISSHGAGSSESLNPSASRQVSVGSAVGSGSSPSKENHSKNVRFSPASSICKSCSSTSISSRTQSTLSPRTTRINRQSIESYSKSPHVSSRRSSEGCHSCPHRRIGSKNSIASPFRHANQRNLDTWSLDKLEGKPPRTGIPNNIEMLNKRSSRNGVNNNLEGTSNKRVTLNTNSCSSCPSIISCGNDSKNSDKSICYKEIRDIDIMGKPKLHNGRIDSGPRRTYSWPIQNPRSSPPRRARSNSVPKVSNASSGSTVSKCSRNSSQSPQNMELVCLPELTGPKNSFTRSHTALPSRDSPGSNARGDLSCSDWEKESSCRRSIVEELKRELLQAFRTEQQIGSQSHSLRPTPHFMIFPFVTEHERQPAPNMNSNPFFRPEPVVCWAAWSKPPTPF